VSQQVAPGQVESQVDVAVLQQRPDGHLATQTARGRLVSQQAGELGLLVGHCAIATQRAVF
jgi:hypothetical protein